MKRTYFVWREIVNEDLVPCGATYDPDDLGVRFVVPMSNPMEYEYPMDHWFDSPQAAVNGLSDFGVLENAIDGNWVLCQETIETCQHSDVWKKLILPANLLDLEE
jgi:hypothetical protein